MLPDGSYAISYSSGFRLFRVVTNKNKNAALFGKRILFFRREAEDNVPKPHKEGWRSFAFLKPDDTVQFHQKFALTCEPRVLEDIRHAVAEIVERPEKAKQLFEEAGRK